MMWVTSHTRPDVSYETCVMSNTGKHPSVKMLHDANKALTKLKSKKVNLRFPMLGRPENLKVIAYSDASHNSLPDGSSQGSYAIFFEGREW